MRRSFGSISTSTSSASGRTRTPAAQVWMRPWDSVTGTRWTRCTPPSYFSRAQTPSPGCGVPARLDRDGDVLVAAEVGLGGVEDLGPPAAPLGVPQVHPQQVAGEQGGLLAALAGLDLEDHVAVVVGVARHAAGGAAARGPRRAAPRAPAARRRRTRRPRPARARRRASPTAAASARCAAMTGASSAYAGRACRASARVGVDAGVGEARARARRAPRAAAGPPRTARVGVRSSRLVDSAVLTLRICTPAAGERSAGATAGRCGAPAVRWYGYLAAASCRSAPRTGRRGRRCRGSSACPCRTGGSCEQTSAWMTPFVAVLRVVNVLPQVQVTCGLARTPGGCRSSWIAPSVGSPGRPRRAGDVNRNQRSSVPDPATRPRTP